MDVFFICSSFAKFKKKISKELSNFSKSYSFLNVCSAVFQSALPAPLNPSVEGFTWSSVSRATAATASGFAMRGKGYWILGSGCWELEGEKWERHDDTVWPDGRLPAGATI